MAVVYMKKLEENPSTYHEKFTKLTKGINEEIQDWIISRLHDKNNILEVGCGPGVLTRKIAQKNYIIDAIDSNFKMIEYAKSSQFDKENQNITYIFGDGVRLQSFDVDLKNEISQKKYDIIISTFMLSELRPLEQQIFLQKCWKSLKSNGRIYLAAEFVPKKFWKIPFYFERLYFKKKSKSNRINTNPLKYFENYLQPIGFKIIEQKEWKHGAIKILELAKIPNSLDEPNHYIPKRPRIEGIYGNIKILRCILTGQVDHVPIEPGLYKSRNPTKESPIIITANYIYTFIVLTRALKNIDAWILCADTRGINVWCAARGPDFGNKQILEILESVDISSKTNSRTIILPQLSAGGVSVPQLQKNIKLNNKYKFIYGPVWAQELPKYLQSYPKKKIEEMKRAKFTSIHRIRAGITHIFFLIRKIFSLPVLYLLLISLLLRLFSITDSWWYGPILLNYVVVSNLIITFLFPLSSFTRKFIKKGIFFGILTIILLSLEDWFIFGSFLKIIWNIPFYFWIAFFSTMSFSGYTFSTGPNEIEEEYDLFSKINRILLIVGVIFYSIGVIINKILV